MKETFGLINAKNAKPPNPNPSPKDFVWPTQKDADDKVAEKLAATLQELLPKRDWKHTDLARALWGGIGPHESPRNVQAARRWILAEHPIPNEETAGYVAQALDVSMARLLEPEGKFNPLPAMVRPRSDSARFAGKITVKKKAKKAGKTPSGKDRKKKREYNEAYRARKKAEKEGKAKRPYVRRVPLKAKTNGAAKGNNTAWTLADGVEPPDYRISSSTEHPGLVELNVTAVMPHSQAMAILHILQHESQEE